MSLAGDAIVWAFDGADGRDGGLRAMIGFYQSHLRELLPPESDDPFEQIVADLADDPTNRMLGNNRLARLFPPAVADEKDADEFWRDSIHGQARARLASSDRVLADLDTWSGHVPVRLDAVDDWARTLGALRLFWYAEVAGPGRLATPREEILESNPGLGDLIEWLGYLIEDLLEMRAVCQSEDMSLDPAQFDHRRAAQ
ncbi:MAG: DUF2017 family protein [Arachnia sp.]